MLPIRMAAWQALRECYVVFGQATTGTAVELSDVITAGTAGFVVNGVDNANDPVWFFCQCTAGDVNGDGLG